MRHQYREREPDELKRREHFKYVHSGQKPPSLARIEGIGIFEQSRNADRIKTPLEKYGYIHGGYTMDRMTLLSFGCKGEEAERWLRLFPGGAKVTVENVMKYVIAVGDKKLAALNLDIFLSNAQYEPKCRRESVRCPWQCMACEFNFRMGRNTTRWTPLKIAKEFIGTWNGWV